MEKDRRFIQGTPEWLEFRRTMIMASDSPVIMGVSPWKTPLQLYHEKINGTQSVKNSSMERGNALEEEARQYFEMVSGVFVTPKVIIDPVYKWMGASLDGINDDGVLVEIKCPGKEDHELALKGEIPKKYYPQLQHQMEVCRLDEMYYFSYAPQHEEKWAIVKVNHDKNYVFEMIKKLYHFYKGLISHTPPSLTQVEAIKMDLGNPIQIDDEAFAIKEEVLANLIKSIKEMEEEAEEIRKELIEMCDDCPTNGSILKFTPIVSKGLIDYSKIPELKSVDLEIYRKKPRRSWRVDFI